MYLWLISVKNRQLVKETDRNMDGRALHGRASDWQHASCCWVQGKARYQMCEMVDARACERAGR